MPLKPVLVKEETTFEIPCFSQHVIMFTKGLRKRDMLITIPVSISRVAMAIELYEGTLSGTSCPYLTFIAKEIKALEKYL